MSSKMDLLISNAMDEIIGLFDELSLDEQTKRKNKQIFNECEIFKKTIDDDDINFFVSKFQELTIEKSPIDKLPIDNDVVIDVDPIEQIKKSIKNFFELLLIKARHSDVYNLYVKTPPPYSRCH